METAPTHKPSARGNCSSVSLPFRPRLGTRGRALSPLRRGLSGAVPVQRRGQASSAFVLAAA